MNRSGNDFIRSLFQCFRLGAALYPDFLLLPWSRKLFFILLTHETGEQKGQLELLIERIEKIQQDLPRFEEGADEQAFTEAASERYYYSRTRGRRRM